MGSGIAAAGSFSINFGVAVYIYRTGTDVHRMMYTWCNEGLHQKIEKSAVHYFVRD